MTELLEQVGGESHPKGVRWRVHTSQMLAEALTNAGMWALRQPFLIFDGLLREVATRAAQLNDPVLNRLMMQLTLYAVADPNSPAHQPHVVYDALYGPEPLALPTGFLQTLADMLYEEGRFPGGGGRTSRKRSLEIVCAAVTRCANQEKADG